MPTLLRLTLILLLWGAFSLAVLGQPQAVILQYHHISSTMPPVTSISLTDFEAHMAYLRDNRFTVLPLDQVLQALQSNQSLPDRTAVVTFDDGYRSVYDAAFPVLKALGWPFTVFVTPGLVGSNAGLYANWDQLREMGESGALLANHTMTHAYLLDRSPYPDEQAWQNAVTQEIQSAQAHLVQETGQDHKILAYPYGEYDGALKTLVAGLGYTALAQNSGPVNQASDFQALPRFPFSGIYAALANFKVKASSLAMNVTIADPPTPITQEQAPEVLLDFDGTYRLDAMTCYHNNQLMEIIPENAGDQRYRLRSGTRSSSRRFHYNCTVPGPDGRYYWYSVPWFNPGISE